VSPHHRLPSCHGRNIAQRTGQSFIPVPYENDAVLFANELTLELSHMLEYDYRRRYA
jgi:hypothetical protein